MGLDQLEALVRERRGVDRDLRAHRPGRVGQSLLRGDVFELLARAAPERAARAGQHERVDLLPRTTFEALERGRMLAVDREQQASATLSRLERELAGGDEALLVCERERDSAVERPERRRQAREADDGIQHNVGLRALQQLRQVTADL